MRVKIWAALLAVYLIWGSTYLAIRYAVETLPPFLMAGTRFLLPGMLLYAWRRLAGDPPPSATQWRAAAVVGLLLLLGGNGLVSWAEQHVASGIAALLIGSVPVWMVLIEALRPGGTRPSTLAVVGLLAGFGGIALLVGPTQVGGSLATGINPAGALALLGAALLWSLGSVYSRGANLPASSLQSTGMQMLTGSAGLFLVGALAGEPGNLDLTAVSARSWLALVYLTLGGSLGGFVAYAWLLRNAPVALVSTYAYVNPLVAILLGNWLAAEPLTFRILAAALVILGSVALINTSKTRAVPSQSATRPGSAAAIPQPRSDT
jgi:drug/metabolite transporter (DMT)-like permease